LRRAAAKPRFDRRDYAGSKDLSALTSAIRFMANGTSADSLATRKNTRFKLVSIQNEILLRCLDFMQVTLFI